MWYNWAAKKLHGKLFYGPLQPSETGIEGYGVLINERLNRTMINRWLWISLILVILAVIVYHKGGGDDSSTFGLGSFLVAVVSCFTFLQAQWGGWDLSLN